MRHATSIDTSDLGAKSFFIGLKPKIDELDNYKLTNFPTSLNNLETDVDDLDVGRLKTAPVGLKK